MLSGWDVKQGIGLAQGVQMGRTVVGEQNGPARVDVEWQENAASGLGTPVVVFQGGLDRQGVKFMAHKAHDQWPDENFKNNERGYRIARQSEYDLVALAAEYRWHARLHGDLLEMQFDTGCLHGVGHEIEIAGGNAARNDQQVAAAQTIADRA